MDTQRFPVGRFSPEPLVTSEMRTGWIEQIRDLPAALRTAVAGLSSAQLEARYRDGGWTIRQVVHHLADSHINAYTRFRLALTEESPTIRPYDEARWAELPDAREGELAWSLTLLDALHARWVALLEPMTPAQWARTLVHPERGELSLDFMLQLYAWHGRHHLAHVTAARERADPAASLPVA